MVLKILGKYQDGRLNVENGYTWISLLYSAYTCLTPDVSVFIALYALTIFWICLHAELKPYNVAAKFLCVKGVIFFSFWQGLFISILVATGAIRHSTFRRLTFSRLGSGRHLSLCSSARLTDLS